MSGGFTGTFKPIHRRFRGEKRREANVGGCRPRGSRDDNEARFQPAFLSLSLSLRISCKTHGEASPSKYAHVSNVHFNHRSHRPSRAIAPSPLSFFLFFFSFFFASDLSFSPARTFHPPSDSIPCNIPLPQSPTYSLETAYTFVRVPPPVFLLLFARLYLSRMQRFVWCFQLLPRLEHREDSIITGEILF